MSIRSYDELCRRDQVIVDMVWSPFRSNTETPAQQQQKQAKLNRDAVIRNRTAREMKAAEIKDAKVKKQKRK